MARRRIYHLGLGGNLGDPVRRLARARALLERNGVRIRTASSLYRTEPVGPIGQPWFINQVLEVEAGLSPVEMLRLAKSIERRLGRIPGPRNGPRTLDIDILLAGTTVLRTADLAIPHPRLAGRKFVLVPLAEIAPRRIHPVTKKTIAALKKASADQAIVERLKRRPSSVRAGANRPLRPGSK